MILLPAIDLRDGAAVRLYQGDYAQQTTYSASPVEVAMKFAEEGAEWLHLVDLDGAKAGAPQHLHLLQQITQETNLRVEMGGGIRSREHIVQVLAAGAERVILGTKLTQDLGFAAEILSEFGDQIVAGIDTKDGFVAAHGWTETAGKRGTHLGKELAELGCQRIIFTDIARDGTLAGPSLEATREMIQKTGLNVIASGGVSCLQDLLECQNIGCEGAIAGKALYENVFSVSEALKVLSASNPEVS